MTPTPGLVIANLAEFLTRDYASRLDPYVKWVRKPLAVLCLAMIASVLCGLYYPSPEEVFEEMSILRGEVVTAALSDDRKHAEHFLLIWVDWTPGLVVRQTSIDG